MSKSQHRAAAAGQLLKPPDVAVEDATIALAVHAGALVSCRS
jgi:hypothetical protein